MSSNHSTSGLFLPEFHTLQAGATLPADLGNAIVQFMTQHQQIETIEIKDDGSIAIDFPHGVSRPDKIEISKASRRFFDSNPGLAGYGLLITRCRSGDVHITYAQEARGEEV